MRVLVTGGAGFIGSHVVRKLLADGDEVYLTLRQGADTSRIEDSLNRVHVLSLNLDDFAEVQSILGKLKFDCAIHLAWYAVPGKYQTAVENLQCVASSLHLAQVLAASGCRRFVGAGSCSEYDRSEDPLNETATPTRPATLYGIAKDSLHRMLEEFFEETRTSFSWVRIFHLYGPWERRHRLVSETILKLMDGQPASCRNGELVRDYSHVQDTASAICAVAKSGSRGTVNIGSGKGVTLRKIVETIAGQLGRAGNVLFESPGIRESEPPIIVADARKLNEGIGWSPSFSLEQGLQDTIDWWNSAAKIGDTSLTGESFSL